MPAPVTLEALLGNIVAEYARASDPGGESLEKLVGTGLGGSRSCRRIVIGMSPEVGEWEGSDWREWIGTTEGGREW